MTREEKENLLREAVDILIKLDNHLMTSRDNAEFSSWVEDLIDNSYCEMTVEEYRQRMIQAFHNADCDELIAICVLPAEKEFEHLEWLLKNHYKQKTKTRHWIGVDQEPHEDWECDNCGHIEYANEDVPDEYHFCPNCGAKMVESQERSDGGMNKWIAEFELEEGDIIPEHIKGAKLDLYCRPMWFPISEKLPGKGEYGKVLVTYIPSGGTLWTTVIIAHYSDLMGIAKPSFHIGEVGKESFQDITEQVIAWMPLPEPYKPQESEVEE